MREAEGRARGTVQNTTGNKRAFTRYGGTNSKITERGTVEKPNCWTSARLTGNKTALIGKGVDGKCPGRIVGLEWVRPGEETQRSRRQREQELKA